MLTAIALTLGVTLILLAAGVWVGVALGMSGMIGLASVLGWDRALSIAGKVVWEQNTSFVLVAIPMFIFMGEILFRSGIMTRIYLRAATLVSGIPGGLLQANIAACTTFAACSGSSVASAATIGSVGYPEIANRNYDKPIALGSIAAGGTLGILIPPSIIFIVYGSLAEQSIGRLFLAGLIPGLLSAFLFSLYIVARCLINPSLAPREARSGWRDRLYAAAGLWQVALLIAIVLGGIYGGVASPTEVAALGAVVAILITMVSGCFSFKAIWRAGLGTIRQTSMILFVIFTAKIIAMTLIYFRVPTAVVSWVETMNLSTTHILLAIMVIYIVLGMFVEGISMMVITIPFLMPIMMGAQMDPIWMGVIVCILIEIGLLTPPVGLNLFVLQGATGAPMRDVITGSLPFVLIQITVLASLYFWPQIALWLPNQVMG